MADFLSGFARGLAGWWLLIGGVCGLLWLIAEVRLVAEKRRQGRYARLAWYEYPVGALLVIAVWPLFLTRILQAAASAPPTPEAPDGE